MARIQQYIPEPEPYDVCSNCKEKLRVITEFDCDDTPYPACSNCHEVIENIWEGWKPKEKDCPSCLEYAKLFDREYDDAYSVYHKNHCCICGHPHKQNESTCINKQCGCTKFISQEGLPELKTRPNGD